MPQKRKNNDVEELEKLQSVFKKIKNQLAKRIVGQEEVIDQLLIS